MKLIKKYIITEFLKPFSWCWILFLFLYWIIDLFDHLDEIVKSRVPLFVLCDYYYSITPFIFVNISPIILLLAIIYTLNNFDRHNEVVAMKAMGVNLWSIIWIFLFFGLILASASFLVNELILPETYLHAANLREDYFKSSSAKEQVIKDITLYGSHNSLFVLGSYDTKRFLMNNITITEHDERNKIVKKIIARRAQWINGYWLFYDCIINQYENGEIVSPAEHFTEKIILIDEKPVDFKRSDLQTNMLGYWDLKKYIRRLKLYGFKAQKERVDFYNKISFPLANFIVVFFAVPFTLSRRRSGGVLLGITTSVVVSFSYWFVNAVSLSFGKIGFLPPLVSAWFANILFLLVGLSFIETVKK